MVKLRVEESKSCDWSQGKSILACTDPLFLVLILPSVCPRPLTQVWVTVSKQSAQYSLSPTTSSSSSWNIFLKLILRSGEIYMFVSLRCMDSDSLRDAPGWYQEMFYQDWIQCSSPPCCQFVIVTNYSTAAKNIVWPKKHFPFSVCKTDNITPQTVNYCSLYDDFLNHEDCQTFSEP